MSATDRPRCEEIDLHGNRRQALITATARLQDRNARSRHGGRVQGHEDLGDEEVRNA